jgi:CheY-like chemotaxis protein
VLDDLPVNLVKARPGKEAVRHAFNTSFAAILMDVRMPGTDGFEAARTNRSRTKSQDTPLLLITANLSDQPNVFKGGSSGVQGGWAIRTENDQEPMTNGPTIP